MSCVMQDTVDSVFPRLVAVRELLVFDASLALDKEGHVRSGRRGDDELRMARRRALASLTGFRKSFTDGFDERLPLFNDDVVRTVVVAEVTEM